MAAVGTPTGRIARSAQVVAYAVVMAVLGALSWRTTNLKLPDVGQFAGIIGAGVLGGIVNPVKAKVGGTPAADAPAAPAAPANPTSAQGAHDDQSAQGAEGAQGTQAAQGLTTPTADATAYDLPWVGAVLVGSAAIIVCALALAVDGPRHVNAAPALTALATAFGALFVDTSKVTHVPNGSSAGGDDSGS